MDIILNSVAGVDVHKKQITITTMTRNLQSGKMSKSTWEAPTFTSDLKKCGRKLLDMGIKDVAMESTGIYWKPIYNIWSDMGIKITLGNATHMKNVPGRKTDTKDSDWIAKLHMSGLIRASFIPGHEFQELRLLTRHRKNLVNEQSRIKNRIQKILEDGNIKLSSVVSDVFGVAGMAIVMGIAGGETLSSTLAGLAKTNLKCKKEDLKKALQGTFTKNQRFVLQDLLTQFKFTEQRILNLSNKIFHDMDSHEAIIEQLITIPGIERTLAEDILSETSIDMSTFANEKMFAAWTGVAPGNNESAGKKKRVNVDMETLI